MRRKRFQKGRLQARKHGQHGVRVASWREDGSRRSKVIGRCPQRGCAAKSKKGAALKKLEAAVLRKRKQERLSA